MAKSTIKFGTSFTYLCYECKPYSNTKNAEDFGIDIYEDGKYICSCPGMNRNGLDCKALRKEFKMNGINVDPWAHYNEKKYGAFWRDLYNGL